MHVKKFTVFATFALLILSNIFFVVGIKQSASNIVAVDGEAYNYQEVETHVNVTDLMAHISQFSPSRNWTRVTGYPGYEHAAQYIATSFERYGLLTPEEYGLFPEQGMEGYFQKYQVTLPMEKEPAQILILPDGPIFKAYTLWPNLLQTCRTPPEGLDGPLIDGGYGTLSDLTQGAQKANVSIEDSIVLLRFNSERNWLNAAKLGAKAILFVEPVESTRVEAEAKFAVTPIYLPRLYVPGFAGQTLYNYANGTVISIKSVVTYETVEAENVIGIIKGSQYPDDIIVFSAYFDSWSIVPWLSPGADEACGVATLLELVKFFAQHPPLRTVMFVAFSGHWQALAGPREFVESFFFHDSVMEGSKKMWMLVSFDFALDSDVLGIDVHQGYQFQIASIGTRYELAFKIIGQEIRPKMHASREDGGLGYDDNRYLEPQPRFAVHPVQFSMDCEPYAVAGGVGFGYVTARNYLHQRYHPFDTVDKIKPQTLKERLYPQALFAFCSAYTFANRPSLDILWSDARPRRIYTMPGNIAVGCGMLTLEGDVVYYDLITGFYSNQSIMKQGLEILIDVYMQWSRWDPRSHIVTKADEKGRYVVHGVPAYSTGALVEGKIQPKSYRVGAMAFVINTTTGMIEYAPDLGEYGDVMFNFKFFLCDRSPMFKRTVVFRCGTTILFDIMDPMTLTTPVIDTNWKRPKISPPIALKISDFRSHSLPLFYGYVDQSMTGEEMAILFALPNDPFEVLLLRADPGAPPGSPPTRVAGLLINATEGKPYGTGFVVNAGEYSRQILTSLGFANDLYLLSGTRLEGLAEYNLHTLPGEHAQSKVKEYLKKSREALQQKSYETAYDYCLNAWNLEVTAYLETMTLITDVTNTIIFFSILLIPFAFVAEKLFVNAESGRRRIISIIGIFLAGILVLYFVHPGFHIASNAFAVVLALAVEIFSLPVLFILIGEMKTVINQIREKAIGLHFAEISRTGAILMAFSVGIEKMRKRRMRTALTVVTLIIITSSLVSLTSASTYTWTRVETVEWPTDHRWPYNGVLIKSNRGASPVPEGFITLTRGLLGYEAITCPRSYVTPPGRGAGQRPMIELRGLTNLTYQIWAIAGMSPEEKEITGIERFIEGSWFTLEDFASCIISSDASETLGLGVGDYVNYMGIDLLIKGIIPEEAEGAMEGLVDLDDQPIAPIDFFEMGGATGGGVMFFVPWKFVLIVPYDLALQLGGHTNTISVKVNDSELAHKATKDLIMSSAGAIDVHVGFDGTVYIYRKAAGYIIHGMQFMLIPLLIAAFTILNLMLTIIYERTREVGTLSAVGLSPLHISGLFLAEMVVYAVLGSAMGYMVGLVGSMLISPTMPAGFAPNYSSSFIIYTVALTMLVTVLASIYPIYKASKLVTPSLERKWKIPTKPYGEEWAIPMPFEAREEEVSGIMAFLREYLESHAVDRAPVFSVRECKYEEGVKADKRYKSLVLNVALAPYDSRLIQEAHLRVTFSEQTSRYAFELYIRRVEGPLALWIKANHKFADVIRKQLLIWRSLRDKDKEKYLGT